MKRLKVIFPLLALALLFGIFSMGTLLAAPGGKGNGNGNGNENGNKNGGSISVEGSLSGSGDLIAWGGEAYTVRGSGLNANSPINLSLASPGCCSGSQVWTDRLGNFSFTKLTGAPGTYSAVAFYSSSKGRPKQVGSVSFDVVD